VSEIKVDLRTRRELVSNRRKERAQVRGTVSGGEVNAREINRLIAVRDEIAKTSCSGQLMRERSVQNSAGSQAHESIRVTGLS
jgi:hypothetical protein